MKSGPFGVCAERDGNPLKFDNGIADTLREAVTGSNGMTWLSDIVKFFDNFKPGGPAKMEPLAWPSQSIL